VTRVLLARHGQSTWNAAGRWQGRADPPLSELGERQAAAAVAAAREHGTTVVFTSPLERARRTGEIVAEALGLGGVTVEDRLMERDAGEWTGLTRDEIEAGWPGYLVENRRPPAFEADDDLVGRAVAALHAIAAAAPGERVLAVSHGGLIRVVERHLGVLEAPPISNLAARHVHVDAGALVLGDRTVLVDRDAVEVTTPRQI
jgi:probable phosphoglycerate mutase